jgi:hypothetical protein
MSALTVAQVAVDSGEGFVTIVILGALFVGGVLYLLGLLR